MARVRALAPFLLAGTAAVPGIVIAAAHIHLPAPMLALLSGVAITAAACILLWACDASQADISAGLALAVVALIAVAPEYAVDMYFTWRAGKAPDSGYVHYAIANMTGANRLLIGVAWSMIAVLFWFKTRKDVRLDPDRRTEILFLGLATVYAFIIPIKGSLAWYDGVVLLGIYAWYMVVNSRRPVTEVDAEGPAELLVALPRAKRRLATWSLFAYAGLTIVLNAEAFSEGLIGTGEMLHINKFLLVQWLAPIASEAPEFIVAAMFAMRGMAGMALGSLLCAKLNQWTLLVGMIPGVYAISHGSLSHPMPLNNIQIHEILLTAAQSLLAMAILANLRLSVGHAILLFALFFGQLISPAFIQAFPTTFPWHMTGDEIHKLYTLMYMVATVTMVLDRPDRVLCLLRHARGGMVTGEDEDAPQASSPQNL